MTSYPDFRYYASKFEEIASSDLSKPDRSQAFRNLGAEIPDNALRLLASQAQLLNTYFYCALGKTNQARHHLNSAMEHQQALNAGAPFDIRDVPTEAHIVGNAIRNHQNALAAGLPNIPRGFPDTPLPEELTSSLKEHFSSS